jgi:hypothetical protein
MLSFLPNIRMGLSDGFLLTQDRLWAEQRAWKSTGSITTIIPQVYNFNLTNYCPQRVTLTNITGT